MIEAVQNITKINIYFQGWARGFTYIELWVKFRLSNLCQEVRNLKSIVLANAIEHTKHFDVYCQRLKKK
jgi:hypothetical protein